MTPNKIKIIFISSLIILLLSGGMFFLSEYLSSTAPSQIQFGTQYRLSEIRPNLFENVSVNGSSYFKINEDGKTGEIKLTGLFEERLDFIITKYSNEEFEIEYIYQDKIHSIKAENTADEIIFKSIQSYRVDITQEQDDAIVELEYDSTIMVFAKEGA